jgi:hypothetical protein
MTKHTIVLGDVHGNLDALKATLRANGVVDENDNKNTDWRVIQVGDLCNMVPLGEIYRGFVSQDFETLQFGLEVIDTILVGNHELFFTHGLETGRWHGMARVGELAEGMMSLISQATWNEQFLAAVEVDGWLVTHAGINIFRPWMDDDPAVVADILCEVLVDMATHQKSDPDKVRHRTLLSDERFGSAQENTIFWCRPWDWHPSNVAPFGQIVGHTPGFDHPAFDEKFNRWIIDNGGYMATTHVDHPNHNVGDFIPALIKREGESDWTPWTRP